MQAHCSTVARQGSCSSPAGCVVRGRTGNRRVPQPFRNKHNCKLVRGKQPRPSRLSPAVCAAVSGAGDATSAVKAEDEEDEEGWESQVTCAPAFVMVDQSNPHYSAFSIDVDDYPGLLRVVSWVFNGVGCRVHNAVMRTDAEGRASDVFWVTDLRGRKLSDADAADVSERLEDFLSFCAPPDNNEEFREFTCGDISISNLAHPTLTQATIQADLFSPGLLLEISSIIHGQGLSVEEAVIRGGSESPITADMVTDPSAVPDPPPGRRVMRFWLKKGRKGSKLDYDDVSALVYTLRAVLGGGNITTQPPNTELTALSCASTADCTPGASSGSDEPCEVPAAGSAAAGSKAGSKRGKGGVTL